MTEVRERERQHGELHLYLHFLLINSTSEICAAAKVTRARPAECKCPVTDNSITLTPVVVVVVLSI